MLYLILNNIKNFLKFNNKIVTTKELIKKEEDGGYDLKSNEKIIIEPGNTVKVHTDVFINHIPKNIHPFILPRSSMNAKGIVAQFGLIDSGYRGELIVVLYNTTKENVTIEKGDKIAQLYAHNCKIVKRKYKTQSERQEKNFGSSGV